MIRKKHLPACAAALVIAVFYIAANISLPLMRLLSDALFFAGLPFVFAALLGLVTVSGFFSAFGYTARKRKPENKSLAYSEYRDGIKPRQRLEPFYFIVAGVCYLASMIFALIN